MSSSTNLISGLASGFDWRSMIDQLMALEHKPVDSVTSKKTEVNNKLTEWQSFNTKLLALKTAAEGLKDPEDFSLFCSSMTTDSATVKASDLLSVSTTSEASRGSYTIVVKNIATAEKWASGNFSSLTDALGASCSGDILINGQTLTISEFDDLADVRDKINALNSGSNATGVTASIIHYGGDIGYRLTLTSDNTGADGISLENASEKDILGSLGLNVLVAGQDASLEIDGVALSSADNTVDDVIAGVTLNLLKGDEGTTVTLNISHDLDGIIQKINSFVSCYNDVAAYIYQQQSYNSETNKTGGILFGDGTLSSVKLDISSLIIQSVWGVSSDFSTLGLAGINLDNEGNLSVDADKLKGYLTTHFNDIRNLFCASGTASNGSLQYIGHTRDTEEGNYNIVITQAATQSTSTSDNSIGEGGLSNSEILTITESGKTATINLSEGMSIDDIVNAINSEVDAVYTQTLAGSTMLYADSTNETPITALTKWNSIYVGEDSPANLENGDVISFSGSTHTGTSISGSYTISDVGQDTVQGLLDAIELAFNKTVTASISNSGSITITDETGGNSQLAINFDFSQAHDLTFGSVTTTNTGGQAGRYAINITATVGESGTLVLTHNSYGSNGSFSIEETLNLLWNEAQTVDNGKDVAGTINGKAATGSGQILTGNDGESDIDGLAIKYTGTSTGDVGTVKLTLGMGELFDRLLYGITDPIDGYVSYKKKSLQNTISTYTTQIEEMEKVLERRQEAMINRFVAMETLLSKLKNQGSWLTSQLSAAANGWW